MRILYALELLVEARKKLFAYRLLAYTHTVCLYEFAEFRIKESFSVELTNCTIEPLTFVRFSASLEIGSLSRGLSAPVIFDAIKR